jgi:predicted HicB family RNase H-like nuclease
MAQPRRLGRPPKLGDHRQFPLRLPAKLHRELRHYALDAGKSLNDILVEVISTWWRHAGYDETAFHPRRPRRIKRQSARR